jgi:hypothetical protein
MKNVKHLLPQVSRYFKTNLHTHSTVSDGKLTPAELKEAYIALGYQVLSLTDHNVIVDYSDMNEPDFLFLTGIEVEFNHPEYVSGSDRPVYHLNLIAKQHDNLWAPGKVTGKFPNAAPFEEKMQCENMDMSYNPEAVNAMIAKANEKGFLVTYNHPTWSCQSYPDYAPLKNVWGMEVRNSECCSLGNNDNNERVFKDLLNLGNRILPLGSDDTHKRECRYKRGLRAVHNAGEYVSAHFVRAEYMLVARRLYRVRKVALERVGIAAYHGCKYRSEYDKDRE